ncbi:MAG: 50S ribosomal protein L22 [Balneolaceae bacterium]
METPTFEAKAVQKHLRKSARKVRLVADAVRGERVDRALKRLEFTKKSTAGDVAKVIKSASANLRDRFEDERLDNDMLFIKTIQVDEGVTMKRIRPRAQGRANRILKHSSHITVVVAKQEEIVTD